MSSNPLNELKRRLDDDNTPLPKRLRLAKNVIHSDHFPAAPKERIVAEWLESITERNGLASKDIRHVISWLQFADELTNDLKCRLIKVVSHYLHSNPLNNEDIHFIINFLENDKISATLQNQIDDYLFIIITLLQNLRNDGKNALIHKLFLNLIKYYKECKKKLKFVIKFLDGENLETIFSYLDSEHRNAVLNVCQNILFPITRKPFFVNFLQHIIKNDNIDNFIADKSENVQSVIKILSTFFMFPKGRTGKDQKFLVDFVDTFVTSYRNEGQILFAFYIMAVSSLNIRQSYLNPEMIIPSITFKENDDKIKRSIFLKMLTTLLENEVDISIKLTDTIGERNKVEIKKNFMSFLQASMLGCLKLEHKTDKTSLQIIKTAIKLDPSIIEQKLDVILPPIMTGKKSSNVKEAYIEMFNCLMETLFKLSRGTVFVEKLLPNIKLKLESLNVEQFELRQKLKDNMEEEKIKNKIITGDDILPQECIEMYGKWTSELMFRQNNGLLTSLQKDLEENCLMMLEEGFVSPSIIVLTEVLSAILSSFFRFSKMADHTVPQQIAEEFWSTFENFGNECLKKFGECLLKLNYNPPLLISFLKLCLSYCQLKLLNLKYGNIKMKETTNESTEIFDCSIVLPCLNADQWVALSQMVQEEEAVITWDNLLLVKLMFTQVLELKNSDKVHNEMEAITKTHIINQLSEYSKVITTDTYITRELFNNLDPNQAKQLAKLLVKLYINGNNCDMFQNVAISKNRILLNALVLETTKCIMRCFENSNILTKAMNKSNFEIESFLQNLNVKDYFNELALNENYEENIIKHIDLLKDLPIYNLEENIRLTAIFVLLAVKKCCQTKKIRRSIDNILLSTYELSPKYPDLYKIFPVDFIFSFQDSTMLNLLKLSSKTSNNMIIIKFILELTVKKVKINSEILKELVEILLSKQHSKNAKSIEYFSDTVFQIQCIILPIIAKEKRAITSSAFRTILANLQEKLHQTMLESFMNIDFTKIDVEDGNIDDSLVTDRGVATLNAIGAYSLTLLKYCEITDIEELKKLDCLWSGLEFFVLNAIKAVENPKSKYQHIEPSIQLLNVILRYIKKLESHNIFQKKDELFKQIWQSIKNRLLIIFDNSSKKRLNTVLLENIAVTLKFLAELSSVDCFVTQFLGDVTNLVTLKKPAIILKDEAMTNLQLTSHQTSKYLLQHCLKANIIGNKCVGITKQTYQICKNLKHWIQIHFESEIEINKKDRIVNNEMNDESEVNLTAVKVDDAICNLLRIDLDMLSEVILAAKKDYSRL
ncbi:PREDICTED: uncharacterized protein LOC106108860 isoform X2 [Papilio polytes]|uniref:uncharacterized protein LOC106108860 isoform X2 n=1 Tax=Papilio polytes TaxID=76194 RepID=UPI000675CCF9|nr:PREDICTED: uncharacterized protein LOC106108860 isoform X2 [Papilio polytes]